MVEIHADDKIAGNGVFIHIERRRQRICINIILANGTPVQQQVTAILLRNHQIAILTRRKLKLELVSINEKGNVGCICN